MANYLPDMLPRPIGDELEQAFWDNCAKRSLAFQTCSACAVARHPPLPICPHCQHDQFAWREAHGPAEIFTFTIIRHAFHPAMAPSLPYAVAIIRYPAMNDVRLLSNVVGDVDALSIDAPVELHWEERGEGDIVPRFRLAGAQS